MQHLDPAALEQALPSWRHPAPSASASPSVQPGQPYGPRGTDERASRLA